MSGLLPQDYLSRRSSRTSGSDPRHQAASSSAYPYHGIGLYDSRSSHAHPMRLSEPMETPRARNRGSYWEERRERRVLEREERERMATSYHSSGSSSHAHRDSAGYYMGSDFSSEPRSGSSRAARRPSVSDSYNYTGPGWEPQSSTRSSSSTFRRRRSGSEAPQYLPSRRPSYFEVRQPYRDLYSSNSGQREYYSGTGDTSSYHLGGYTSRRPSDRPWH